MTAAVDVGLTVMAVMFWILNIYYAVLNVSGLVFRSRRTTPRPLASYPSVSVLIPAHNEEKVLAATLAAMVKLTYPGKLEILVLNDASNDLTGTIAEAFREAYRHVRHVSVPPRSPKGKASALNYGLTQTRGEWIAVYDADNQPEPGALQMLVEAAVGTPGAVGAVGYVKTLNAYTNVLTRMIAIEFSVFQLLMQAGRWAGMDLGSLPGTNMVVSKDALEAVGAWDPYALAEDAALTVALAVRGGKLPVVPEARTWEQEPQTLRVWWRQRTRWMQGNIYLLVKLVREPSWRRPSVLLHTIHILSVYVIFVAFLIVSDIWFFGGELVHVHATMTMPLTLLWFESFVFYVIQLLSAQMMDGLLGIGNAIIAAVMYFTYAQLWVALLLKAAYLEIRRMSTRAVPVWDKTVRF